MPEKTILQAHVPYDITPRGLPGVRPLEGSWLVADDAYGAQMALRVHLLATSRGKVIDRVKGSGAAEAELLEAALSDARFLRREGDHIMRPDGVSHTLTGDALWDLGHLFQNDFVIMEKRAAEHVLSAAVLCFPANWTLSEKIGRPLGRIHAPVPDYDAGIAARVQRLFDGVQVGHPLWRFNALRYDDPALFQPKREEQEHIQGTDRPYLRSERQVILRLPKTRAVVFSIHTTLIRADGVGKDPDWSI